MGSPTEKAQELQEAAEHGSHEAHLAPVSLTMAILAVLVAFVSVLGHRAHTEEIILQNKVTDQWAYYQAKNIRRSSYELFLDLLKLSEFKDQKTVASLKEKYQGTIEKYAKDQKEIDAEARKLEAEVDLERHKADRYDVGDWPGRQLHHTADKETLLLGNGNASLGNWDRDRGPRVLVASLKNFPNI
jgi:hypothetical protein